MFRYKADVAMILGAGFSKNAGIPLQMEFSDMILSNQFNDPIDIKISYIIKDFLKKVFGWGEGYKLPSLEDMFTFIDLSSGIGHCLGREYPPKKLRALRRMLIYRCFEILDHKYISSKEIHSLLETYIPRRENEIKTHFIVLNWDIVLERQLEKVHNNPKIDYCINCQPWNGDYGSDPPVAIAKVHGSSNWVYCDNCHSIYYDRDKKLSREIRAGLLKSDFELFNIRISDKNNSNALPICPKCNYDVGPHIATFSYRKSFRTHAFTSSWLAAEQILDQANLWVFIGYSLPFADYEFKHLLKSSQLKFSRKKDIHVVLKEDNEAQKRYEALFGKNNVKIFQDGIKGYLEDLGMSYSNRPEKPGYYQNNSLITS